MQSPFRNSSQFGGLIKKRMCEENDGHEIDEIAKRTYELIKDHVECSYTEITNHLSSIFKINQMSIHFKRKIHDALSILEASGAIECHTHSVKLNNTVKLVKSNATIENVSQAYNQVIKKENELRFKLYALLKYWSLMKYRFENKIATDDSTKIQIPFILIKATKDVHVVRNKGELEITFDVRPSFYSPQDILSKMNYPMNPNEFIKEYPRFAQTFWNLFEQN